MTHIFRSYSIEDGRCAICYDDLKSNKAVVEHWNPHKKNRIHQMHESCLRTWNQTQQTCPICRESIDFPSFDRFNNRSISLITSDLLPSKKEMAKDFVRLTIKASLFFLGFRILMGLQEIILGDTGRKYYYPPAVFLKNMYTLLICRIIGIATGIIGLQHLGPQKTFAGIVFSWIITCTLSTVITGIFLNVFHYNNIHLTLSKHMIEFTTLLLGACLYNVDLLIAEDIEIELRRKRSSYLTFKE